MAMHVPHSRSSAPHAALAIRIERRMCIPCFMQIAASQPDTSRLDQLRTPQGAAAAVGVAGVAFLGLRALFGSGSRYGLRKEPTLISGLCVW